MGRVHSPILLTTNILGLIEFSNMQQWLHHSWFLAKSLLSEAATVDLPAGLRSTASRMESSALAYCLFFISSNISLVYNYIWRTEEDPTHLPVARQKRLGSTHYISSTIKHDSQPAVGEELYKLTAHCMPPTPIDFDLYKRRLWLTLSKAALNSSWTVTLSLHLKTTEGDEIW